MRVIADRFIISNTEPRRGGMAEIHRAADHKDNLRPVAIKFMNGSQIHDDRIVREAFSRELTALHALDHPSIVKIIDFDARHDPPYMVLEWLERDLTAYLDSTVFRDWDDFYDRIGGPVLRALSYALTKRLVHRDLKPGNVLIDDHGCPKVADFGISKFYTHGHGGFTLGSFRSEPYAPFEEAASYSSRDPYSFAVLALRSFSNREFTSHEEVTAALEAFQGPPSVHEVLRHALHQDVSSRFASVAELHEALERSGAARLFQAREARVCYVVVFPQVVAQLARKIGEDDQNTVRRLIEQDLAESSSFFFWHDKESGKRVERHFLVRTPQLRLRLAIREQSGDQLVVQNIWLDESEHPDVYSDYGLHPALTFRFGPPPPGVDGAPVVRWLVEALKQHELEDADARRNRREEQILREWAAALRFRQHLDDGRYPPIPYAEYSVDGNRVSFSIPHLPDGVALEQTRLIRREQRIICSGVVDDVAAERVVLWVEKGLSELPPERGQLTIDNHASRIALDRQKGALDAVRYGRCVRPALRTLILDPSQSRTPSPVQVEGLRWIQAGLDDDKKVAVSKALGAEDILVVHGPPGTGKTVFITELVKQLLERDPDCKILLTSQTHVALDNALEGCNAAIPTARLLRVAQRDDDRVSSKVQELTIDRVADRWRSDVAKASEKFLASSAAEMGVRREDIALGIAVGRLRVESAELDRIVAQLGEREKILASAEQNLAEAQIGLVADVYAETSDEINELREQVRELNQKRKTVGARRRKAAAELAATGGDLGAQLAEASTDELAEWEQGLLAGSQADRKFYELLRLAEEWQLRFGRSREFYGAMIADSSVVAGTCIGFASVPGMLAAEFDVCIVDEASKATATELLVPLSRARRWILVGDSKQLPPFVEDLLDDSELLKEYELDRDSFQTTLLDRFVNGLPDECIASLTTQHRMIRPIGNLISECFYEGKLNSIRDERDDALRIVMPKPVTWLTTARLPQHDETEFNKTFKNVAEARVIGQWLRRLDFIARAAGKTYRVGLIAGYLLQATELQRLVASIQGSLSSLTIECNTVDAFQGRQVDVCVYSVTRCNQRGLIGFLRDERRMNVALSRGRSGLLIVGDHLFCQTAKSPNPLRAVVSYIERHHEECGIVDAEVSA